MRVVMIMVVSIVCKLEAQTPVPSNVRAAFAIDRVLDLNGIPANSGVMFGIPLPPKQIVGDTYLDTAWHACEVTLYEKDKLVKGFRARYDIDANGLEVKINKDIRFLEGNKMKQFSLHYQGKERTFINAKQFESTPVGFFEVLSRGKIFLLKRMEVAVKQADYIPAFDMGSRNDKIVKSDSYYYSKQENAIELPSSQKKLKLVLQDLGVISNDVKSKNLGKEETLVHLFDQYNANQ